MIVRFLRWRQRKAPTDEGLIWAEFRARQDVLTKESYRRTRAAEEDRD